MELPEEVRLLIDRYVSEQNALGSRYGELPHEPLQGFQLAADIRLRCGPPR